MAEPILAIRDLSVDYISPRGAIRAVDRLSFDIAPGEVFGLAGESGSGKSTAAMAILRILGAPAVISGGEVRFRGRDVLAMSEAELLRFRWAEVALVFQSAMNALNPLMRIGEQIADVLMVHKGFSREQGWSRAAELLELVGIEPKRVRDYPHQLSGGMRQRVVIAIALALEPSLLIMDEPTTALDVVVQKEILKEISSLKDKLGFAVLFITHDLGLMLEFCNRIGVLYAGRLCEVARAEDLYRRPQHPYTKGLLESFPDLVGPKHRLTGIGGTPPDLSNPPPGCRFLPRCSVGDPTCALTLPRLVLVAEGQEAACTKLSPLRKGGP